MVPIAVIGCGGHGRVIRDTLRLTGDQFAGFLDDQNIGKMIGDDRVLGGTSYLRDQDFLSQHDFIVGIGDTKIRRLLSTEILARGGRLARAVHPTAILSADVTIGEGTVVMAGVIINTGSTIGRFAVINTGAIIDHDNIVEDGVHISPGCQLAGGVRCAQDAFIGTGVSVIPRKRIGQGSIVAAGATVISDVAPQTLVAGCPAVFKRRLED